MRLSEAIAATEPEGIPLKVDELLTKIHPDDVDETLARLRAPMKEWSHVRMADMLSKMSGEDVTATAIRKWRDRQASR